MKKTRVSVVIPGKNCEKTIRQCVESILAQSYPDFEVIYVDNNSSDKSKKIASEYPIKVLTEKHVGSFIARNTGVRNASGEILVFTDADCVAEEEWVVNLVKPITEGKEAACIGKIESAEENAWSVIEQQTFDDLVEHIEQEGYVSRAYTGNLAVKKSVFEELKGFDGKILWNADTDLSLRLIKAGYRIRYVPNAKVRHFHRTSLARIFKRKFQQGYWANRIYRKNNGEPKEYGRMIREMKKTITLFTLSLASLVASLYQPFRTPAYIASTILFLFSAYEFTCPTTMIYITKKRTLKQKVYMLTYFFGWRIGLISSLIK